LFIFRKRLRNKVSYCRNKKLFINKKQDTKKKMNGIAYYKLTDGDRLMNPPPMVSFQNLLPFSITAILKQGDGPNGQFKPLVTLGAKERKSIVSPGANYEVYLSSVKAENEAEAISLAKEGQYLTMPIKFGTSSQYYFGGVAWNSFEMDTNMYNLYADLPGVRVINHFPFPVYVQYKNLAFTIPKGSWENNYSMGSTSQVYFDNQGSGLMVGENFTVKALETKLYDFKIPNRFVRNIHLGVTNTA
jgi:hypothetical protein